jgi:tetratricopeptide (TPR) repeat protein
VRSALSTSKSTAHGRGPARWWPRGLGLAGLILGVALLTGAPASAQPAASPAPSPWQTLMSAAAEASSNEDYVTAEALLNAALEVALKVDPRGPRPVLSRLMLQLTYADLDKMEMSQRLGSLRLDVATLDPTLLTFATTLNRLANRYYDRWKVLPVQTNDEAIRKRKSLLLAESERCLLIKWAIQNKLLPPSDSALASTIGFHGLVFEKQGKLPDAIAKYEAAVKIWNEAEDRHKRLMLSSTQFSLFSGRGAGVVETTDDPVSVKSLLGRAHMWTGEEHLEKKKEDEAVAAFRRAEPIFLEIIRYFDQVWPDHPRTAIFHSHLGNLYGLQRRFPDSIVAYRKSLTIYDTHEGGASENTRFVVQRLAKILRNDKKDQEAAELEARYGL